MAFGAFDTFGRLGGVLPAGNRIVAKNNEIETMARDPEGSVV